MFATARNALRARLAGAAPPPTPSPPASVGAVGRPAMREQVELCFFIGHAGAAEAAFEAACIELATHLCGGCFVADGTGYWREGGERRAARFEGRLRPERTLCLKLTTELAKEREVLLAMRAGIARAAAGHGLVGAIRWVHVQRHPIVGLHFSIEDALRAAA